MKLTFFLAVATALFLQLPADAATRKWQRGEVQTLAPAQAEYNRRIAAWGFGGWPYTHNPFAQDIKGGSAGVQ
jgi:hypothetical protein